MSTIKSVEPIVVEEDHGLKTPGAIVSVEYELGEVVDRYCGFCVAHINNNVLMCFNVYTKIIYREGTYEECKEKLNELKAKMIDTHLSDVIE